MDNLWSLLLNIPDRSLTTKIFSSNNRSIKFFGQYLRIETCITPQFQIVSETVGFRGHIQSVSHETGLSRWSYFSLKNSGYSFRAQSGQIP